MYWLLWDPPASERFAASVVAREAAFRELGKNSFPEIYAILRAPVNPTVAQGQVVNATASMPCIQTEAVPMSQVPPPSIPTADLMLAPVCVQLWSAPNQPQAPAQLALSLPPSKGNPSKPSGNRIRRRANLTSAQPPSYKGQPHTGARVEQSTTSRQYSDIRNQNKREKRAAAKQ